MGVRTGLEDGHLLVKLTGWDRVLSIRRQLKVPLSAITGVEAKSREEIQRLPGRWLRLPGTYVPSMVHHGSYGRRPNRDFWALFRQERVLVIRIDEWDYQRIVLGMDDPDSVAAELARVVG
jgi:hypothetical protein